VKSVVVYVSDFGRKKMDEEVKFGPRGIWKKKDDYAGKDSVDPAVHNNDEDEEFSSEGYASVDEENDDDADDIYDFVDGDNEVDSQLERRAPEGDFQRKGDRNQSVGLVFHEDLVRLGKAAPLSDEDDEDGVAAQPTQKKVVHIIP